MTAVLVCACSVKGMDSAAFRLDAAEPRYQTAVAAVEQYGWQAIHGDTQESTLGLEGDPCHSFGELDVDNF